MDKQITLDGSSLLEKTQHREAIPVFLNEEQVHDGGELGTNSSMLQVYDWKIRSLLWWSRVYVFLHLMRKGSSEEFFFSGTRICRLSIFSALEKTLTNPTVYIFKKIQTYLKTCNIQTCIWRRYCSWWVGCLIWVFFSLNLLVEFLRAIYKTITFSFKGLFLKSENNVWTYMRYVIIWNI